ncbi:hypothetical protein ACFYXV_10660 [Streptomyces sp. NPDC002181]
MSCTSETSHMFAPVRDSLDPMTTPGAPLPGATTGTVLVARRRRA